MADSDERYLYAYTWKIENFLCARNELKSPPICIENLNNSKWFIKVISPQPNKDGYISCYLVPADENNKVSEITCMLEILDEEGKNLMQREFYFRPYENEFKIGLEKFISFRNVEDVLAHSKKDVIIVRCRIGKGHSSSVSPIGWETKSLVEAFLYSFKYCANEKSLLTISKKINFMNGYFNIILNESEDCIEISLNSSHCFDIICVSRVLFLHNDNELFRQRSSADLNNWCSWKFPSIQKSVLEESRNNGTITVVFDMAFSKGEISNMIEFVPSSTSINLTFSQCKDPVTVLQEDLRLLFVDQIGCDVKLRAGDEIFSAHKSTLSARSPVFRAMFDQDMIEKKTGIVDISDTGAETLKAFLVFCYNATVEEGLDCEKAINLIILADKYQVTSLKETCSNILMSVLNDKNVCQVLKVADMVGSETLKEDSMRIFRSESQKILLSHDWAEFAEKNTRLAIEVLQKVIIRSCNK